MSAPPNFDRLAKPYRWMEYASFGPLLHRTRTHCLQQLAHCQNGLVLGDGDGRFTYALLASNPHIRIHAVDISGAMLRELRRRCATYADRLTTTQCNALNLPANLGSFDLIVTHFFLDCFAQQQIETLVPALSNMLQPEGRWLISDFAIPANAARVPARLLVRSLYAAFRLMTGLNVTGLPHHAAALRHSGLHQTTQHEFLAGVLKTELWRK